ncbi:peptide MFS transporter [Dysgonomonas sp. 25]|uniref:peptide MFS transporter n=1 Tax=Dysgonomonas sp. 25 TaxID=2302933 RepID=UPI0013D1CBAE|nr:peptide MFS transporter [Dysgonomonas sp. 25]NDV69899.1 MFS transporter [Dysgonomonas sp. 25]
MNSEIKKKGHPKGLYMLFFVEMWERFSYFGMRGILMLYLTKTFLEGGLSIDPKEASLIYGFFTGFVYFTPLIGGWLADQFLGQRRAIYIGCLVMALGQFCLFAINTHFGLMLGLILLIIGNGFFKPNISTLVGKLYSKDDPRKDSAFSIFYMGVNLGALIAPIVIGILTDGVFATHDASGKIIAWGYKYGFLAASIGMILGFFIFSALSKKYLGDVGLKPTKEKKTKEIKQEIQQVESGKLTSADKQRIAVIFIYFFFAIFFFAGFEQAGSSLTLYTENYIDRVITLPFIGAWEIPTPIFQSVNPFFIVTLAPLFAIFWGTKFGRRLSTPIKMGSGMIILGLGFFFMLGAVSERGGDIADVTVKASLWWLVMTYLVHTIGELCLSPVGLSVVTKLSPPKLASVLMAVWMLASFFANILGGVLASTVQALGAGRIFLYISIFVIGCGLLMICLNKVILKMSHGIR